MAGARAAIRYAKAMLSLAKDQNSAEAVSNDMKLFAKTIAQSQDLSDMLQSPVIGATIKKSALLEIFKNSNTLTVNLIDTLIANRRLSLLENVALQYVKLYDESRGMQEATVTTAVALTEELTAKVSAKVKALTGKDAELINIIDESILGGFILRVGDLQYNASIANQLSKLKREFTLN
ncbi:ATP synthase F1 subunit delta [Bizionia gelidisalsuginis]|uniref:ATP synthase subunit delta n=2 Tax=Bizionia TaxID=283785 RepID=A0A8H2LCM6_9FLAO|nr:MULTISPECIES: ATP synthase F1 subunit delta [Bizionia]TYB74226.1 ATP synthase F1 subunit delta [Bizionia saleffrena]TYC15688.1 ATP synthase F1 subunit delta [Bizionia gelidisalsuginis]